MQEQFSFDTLVSIGPYLFIGALLASLIPAAVSKWLMSLIFGHSVSFMLILIVSTLTVLISVFVLFWLGLLGPQIDNWDMPLGPSLLLTVASYLLQATMLTLFAPDADGDFVPLWKWLVVLVAQYVLYVLISILLGMLFVMAAIA